MKKVTYMLIYVFVLAKKKNRKVSTIKNVGPTKPVKVLYEQKLVYWNQLKN